MKVNVSTLEYIEYRDKHIGCIDLGAVKYELYNHAGEKLSEGTLTPTEADRELVRKKLYSSVVLACLDSHLNEIRTHKPVGRSESGLSNDAFMAKAKAVVWQVEAIDEDIATVYVRGVA